MNDSRHRRAWLRPIIWFPVAYTLVIIVHEAAHAATAAALGFPATLFNFWVDYQLTEAALGAAFLPARLVEGSLWIFAAAGVMTAATRHQDEQSRLGLQGIDALAVIAV